MRIVVTLEEKQEVQKNADDFAKLVEQSKISPTFMKLIINHLNSDVPNLDQITKLLQNKTSVSVVLARLIESLIKSEDEAISDGLIYSTTDLAKYFQVSQTTINKWINQGRFIGVSRERNKHSKIHENVEWTALNGSRVKIKEIVENYQNNHMNPPEMSKDEEREEILFEIDSLKEKYGGDLEKIMTSKEILSSEEERDFVAWSHFSKMLKDYE